MGAEGDSALEKLIHFPNKDLEGINFKSLTTTHQNEKCQETTTTPKTTPTPKTPEPSPNHSVRFALTLANLSLSTPRITSGKRLIPTVPSPVRFS